MKTNELFRKIDNNKIDTYVSFFPKKEDKIYAQLFIRAGYCFADSGKKFIPHLLEHVISYDFMENDLEFEGITGNEYLIFCFESKKKEFLDDFQKFMNSIFSKSFSEESFENEKMALINEMEDKSIKLSERSFVAHSQIRYKTKYYAHDKFNKTKIVKSTLSEIEQHRNKYFTDKNMKLLIGTRKIEDKTAEAIKKIINLANINKGTINNFPDPGQFSSKCYLREKYDSPKIHLSMTWPCPSLQQSIKERVAINVIRDLLVYSYKSILFQKLRIKNSTIYNVGSETFMLQKAATFSINLSVEKNKIDKTIETIKTSIDEIKKGEIDKKLFDKNISENIEANNREWDSNGRFSWVVSDLVDFDQVFDAKEHNKINKSLTMDYLSSVAKKYLDHNYLNIIEFSR